MDIVEIWYTDHTGKKITLERDKQYELRSDEDGTHTIPAYIITTKDDKKYLVFAPDMDAVKHMHCYSKLVRNVKERYSDHEYDPIRKCISPAFCDELDDEGSPKVLQGPVQLMGNIYRVE